MPTQKEVPSSIKSESVSKPDKGFIILIIIFFSALAWMLTQVQTSIQNIKLLWKDECDSAQKETGFEWPLLSEFWITIAAAFACYFMNEVSVYLMYPYYYGLFEFEKVEKARVVKSKKNTDKAYSFIYHVFIISYGYIVLSETDYLPKMLGGRGGNNFETLWSEYPCIKTGGYEESLRMYYLITLGYRVFKTYLLIYQWCLDEHRSDFIEMFLHHSLTLSLYAFSLMQGQVKIGSIIMYLHDLVEPLNNLAKIFADTKAPKIPTMLVVITFWLVWGWTRIVVFPQIIYKGLYIEAPKQLFPNRHIESHIDFKRSEQLQMFNDGQMVSLMFLQVLHVFWFFLLTRGIYTVATKGKIIDPQERVEVEQKEKTN